MERHVIRLTYVELVDMQANSVHTAVPDIQVLQDSKLK